MNRSHAVLFVSHERPLPGKFLSVEAGQNLSGKIHYEFLVNHQIALILSFDSPSGTGDHENYFHRKDRVLEVDGTKIFQKCKKNSGCC